ncbi:GNAT family N-acetyltransferase [candidate division WOR-3 bacterium]|nr:GNAT family N-acetyltransferase [candidate division WOR-3 bacterium]
MSRGLVVRPMTMEDKPAVLQVSSRIWEGNDYVPLFFDRWVKQGGFWAAELRGRIAGYGKATELAPGEWWLEGLRVDPACRNRGIGKELSRRVLQRTLDERPVSLRLATADVNHESMHIITAVMGFKPYTQYRFFVGKPAKRGLENGDCTAAGSTRRSGGLSPVFPPLVRPAAAEAFDYIKRSPEFAASKGLLQYTWLYRQVDHRYIAELKRGGHVLGHRKAGKLDGLLILRPHRYRGNDLDISFAAGGNRALTAFGSYLSRVARERGTRNISGVAASDEMASAFRLMGLKRHPRMRRVLVYEYPI